MQFSGDRLFVLPGEKWVGPTSTKPYIMIYENNLWTNIDAAPLKNTVNVTVTDFSSIAVEPDDNKHYFITSASSGVYEFENEDFINYYNKNNSTNQGALGFTNPLYQWVDNAILDENNNLWITNDLVPYSIKVKLANGTWTQLHYEGIGDKQSLGAILICKQNPNQKWVLSRREGVGVGMFDDNGTIENPDDDTSVFYTSFYYTEQDKKELIVPTLYFCITQDQNNVIWIGTDKGPLLFNNPSNAFNTSDFECYRVKIPRNDGTGLADYLLDGEKIKTIVVDGANRKWIGTESSGVYLMSANGQQTIHHFTAENSPLLSNSILSIAINKTTGEVFFGTTNGLVSYQSDAAESTGAFENVHAYPNPVRENYTGIITITGLIDKTNVKITDLAGNLVCQTVSNGSIATWDGKNG